MRFYFLIFTFTNMERTEISDLGEFGLIDRLTQNRDTVQSSTLLGVGDDAAVIDHFGRQTVVATDILIEGIHFDLAYTPLKHLGYKSVVVNLSDIYAMMATPTQITVSIAFSNRFSVEALDELYEGIHAACKNYQVDLIGGDTSSSHKGLILSITALGEVAPNKFVTRGGAKKGDLFCVSGTLGDAFLGLTILEREKKIFLESPGVQPDLEGKSHIVGRLLKPEPRRDVVERLEALGIVPTSMIDVSDGLSSEVLHICKNSGCGAVIYEEKIPIHQEARDFAYQLEIDPTACALSGGEDYELLFTIPQSDWPRVQNETLFTVIGYVTEPEKKAVLFSKGGQKHELIAQGWRHV